MEYTKNYHLPQWVKSDRIMMEDFNQMCMDLESRLSSRDGTAADGSTLTWEALLRGGWNLLDTRHTLADQSAVSAWNGVTVNPLANESMAGSLSGITWLDGGGVYVGAGPDIPDTILRNTCTGYTTGTTYFIESSPDSRTATYSFTAPLTGSVVSFILYCQLLLASTRPSYSGKASFLAEEKSGSGWRTVYQKSNIPMEYTYVPAKPSDFQDRIDVNIPIVEGREYRLTLRIESGGDASGSFGFIYGVDRTDGVTNPDTSLITLKHKVSTSGSHWRTVSPGGRASRALVIAYYRTAQSGGSVSAVLNGQAMTQAGTDAVTYRDGKSCYRACFQMSGNFTGGQSLQFSLSCQASNTLRLLSYAVMFL